MVIDEVRNTSIKVTGHAGEPISASCPDIQSHWNMGPGKKITTGIATSPVNECLAISANTAFSRDFRLRQIASVKCCPYIMLQDHGPWPLYIVWTKEGYTLSKN